MTKFATAQIEALNTKTGSTGWAVSAYNRTTDGKAMVEVFTGKGRNAHWEAASVELSARAA